MSEQQRMPAEKLIFQFFDGTEHVWGDPLAINRRLTHACGGDINAVVAASKPSKKNAEPVAIEQAKEILVRAIRYAFGMVDFNKQDGTGATDDECFAALNAYSAFLEKKNPSAANSQTCLPPTEEEYSPGDQEETESFPMASGWGSGPTSTDNEP